MRLHHGSHTSVLLGGIIAAKSKITESPQKVKEFFRMTAKTKFKQEDSSGFDPLGWFDREVVTPLANLIDGKEETGEEHQEAEGQEQEEEEELEELPPPPKPEPKPKKPKPKAEPAPKKEPEPVPEPETEPEQEEESEA